MKNLILFCCLCLCIGFFSCGTSISEADEKEKEAANEKAMKMYFNKDFSGAIAAFRANLKKYPDATGETQYMIGSCYVDVFNYERAFQEFEACLNANSKNKKCLVGHVFTGRQIGQMDKIKNSVATLEKNHSDELVVMHELGAYHLGSKNYEKSLSIFNQLMEKDSVTAELTNTRGYVLMEMGKYREAVSDFDEAIKLSPNFLNPYNNKGLALHKAGDSELGKETILSSLLINDRNPYGFKNLGLIFLDLKDKKTACQNFQMAVESGYTKKYGKEVEELILTHCKEKK